MFPLIIVYYICDTKIFISVIWGFGISSFLMIIGFFALKFSLNKSAKIFLGTVIGGILFRLIIILLSGLYVHYFTQLEIIEFFISLLGYYLFFQFIEIIYFNRNVKKV